MHEHIQVLFSPSTSHNTYRLPSLAIVNSQFAFQSGVNVLYVQELYRFLLYAARAVVLIGVQ